MTTPPRVILASGSASRAQLLTAAGVPFAAVPPHVDEDSVKAALRAEQATSIACAETLAEMKAVKVSRTNPDALVIGADQMLELDGHWFDKPANLDAARGHLLHLAAKTHLLPTAVVVAQAGGRIWHHTSTPRLTMRAYDPDFVDIYLAMAGTKVLSSVGAYQLEGVGVQLFQKIEGDFFTILGLPLLPLLAFLREHGVLPS